MGSKNYRIITNNPLVLDRLKETHDVVYREISYEEILSEGQNSRRAHIVIASVIRKREAQ